MTATLLERQAPGPAAAPRTRVSALAERLHPALPDDRGVSWLVTLGVTGLAAWLRFADLARPKAIAFDETYYMKDAFSYLRFGYERSFVDNANDQILASDGNWRTLNVFNDSPAFVVHPPVGKWTIAAGEYVFGLTPFGWRVMMALLGTLTVLLVVRIARRLTRSTLIGALAGFLLAIDGMAIVMSRTALLDNSLAFWVVVAFGCVLMDRDRTRGILATRVRTFVDDRSALDALSRHGSGFGPWMGLRPWRWAAGLALGLACGTKWSGVWFLAAFGLLTVFWDIGMRRVIGVRTLEATLGAIGEGLLALVSMGAVAIAVYITTWTGWLLTDGGYDRQWADTVPAAAGFGWVPDGLRSLLHYHSEMLNFHVHLTSPHSYQSNAWSWLLQTRPTSFYYESPAYGVSGCTVDKCSSEVLALGNPLLWWMGTAALIHQSWRWFARRDWRSGAVVLAILAGWLPWLGYQGRTIFTFYSVAFVPFLCIALAMTLGVVIGPSSATATRRTTGGLVAGGLVLILVAVSWFFYPIWSADVIPYTAWNLRMWFPTWV